MEKATIYDYVRACRAHDGCNLCPLKDRECSIRSMTNEELTEANEIILKWCKEHPAETRQDRFLKMFPNARMTDNGVLEFCPQRVDTSLKVCNGNSECIRCYEKYWLAEVDE